MARPRIHVRVIDLPDGTLEPTKRKSLGREITRLSFHKGNHRLWFLKMPSGWIGTCHVQSWRWYASLGTGVYVSMRRLGE